ncbi:hypothetical protein K466DRAFT_47813 [Polyporus arcularius HHB13444]|uniref:Secreted protein n=1 Tax=Polyporus arcularius HHB13444 TaxID=1314778 RepID=A0A5C3Q619_9APHY|nr:hypothetical protein K466DRAFT_47813 [Polyporus arcularius HHB13444]
MGRRRERKKTRLWFSLTICATWPWANGTDRDQFVFLYGATRRHAQRAGGRSGARDLEHRHGLPALSFRAVRDRYPCRDGESGSSSTGCCSRVATWKQDYKAP